MCRCRLSNKGRYLSVIFLVAANESAQVPAVALEKFECPIAFIGSGIRRPVRNDILVAPYTIDQAGIVPTHFIKISNEPFQSSKLMHDGTGLGSVQLKMPRLYERPLRASNSPSLQVGV